MRFGSVCSGIEAASVAWHPLGWRAAWLAEIEPFPSAVLAHHYPDVPNYGDMTALPQLIRSSKVEAPDLFCGGTPCQAFSVAGLRRSLDDERGNLSLKFVEIADAIDDVRRARGDAECIVFWENVPGVFSTADNAFGCFLGALAGCDTAIEPLAATGWTDAGVVAGPARAVAWRVLDAQYFGLAQRRKRVFVVASAREGFDPAAVLLEFDGLRRDTAPSREAREGTTHATAPCLTSSGRGVERTGDTRGQDPVVAMCLNAKGGAGRLDAESETLIPTNGGVFDVTHTLRGEGFDASEDGTGRGTPLVPVAFDTYNQTISETAQTLCSRGDTPGGNAHLVPAVLAHAFDARQSDVIQYGDKTGPLDTDGHSVGVAIPIDTMNHLGRGDSHSFGDFQPGAPSYTLTKGHSHAVAALFIQDDTTPKVNEERAGCLRRDAGGEGACVMTPAMQVRRLTPVECSRLQGFPDDYLELTYADADEAHSAQVLHELWQEAGAPTVEKQGWRAGISAALLAPEILLAGVYGGWLSWELAERCAAARGALPGEDYCHEGFVLALREAGKARRSPYKRESFGQLARKLGSGLSILPLESAQARKVLRSSRLWPEAQAKWPLRYALAKGKAREAIGRMNPDGPRYKALGNSWAVPVVRWIGQRIQEAL